VKKAVRHLRVHIFRGFLALIPLVLSYFVVRFLYLAVDQRVARLLERWLGFKVPGLGIVLVLVVLYLLGLVASNWAGRWVLSVVDRATTRIPLIKTVYKLGKQLAGALSLPEKQAFKRVVIVEHFRQGLWSVAFVTGEIRDRKTGGTLLKLFIPTAPNPTTGFSVMAPPEAVRDLPWTMSEAMTTILSGGIVSPEEIG
jgi:uncharacterized membrane protein